MKRRWVDQFLWQRSQLGTDVRAGPANTATRIPCRFCEGINFFQCYFDLVAAVNRLRKPPLMIFLASPMTPIRSMT
jgi:hypothetical protein